VLLSLARLQRWAVVVLPLVMPSNGARLTAKGYK